MGSAPVLHTVEVWNHKHQMRKENDWYKRRRLLLLRVCVSLGKPAKEVSAVLGACFEVEEMGYESKLFTSRSSLSDFVGGLVLPSWKKPLLDSCNSHSQSLTSRKYRVQSS